MIFGMALEMLKTGEKVTRPSWPPQWKAYLVLEDGKLFRKGASGQPRRLHVVGIGDLLANDWEQYDDLLTFKGVLKRGLRGKGTGRPRIESPECNLDYLKEPSRIAPGCLCGHGETCDICKPRR